MQSAENLPDALRNFDQLPDSANVRIGVVMALVGQCSDATVWRMSKDGRLPKPRRLTGKLTAWNVGELRKALAAL